MALYRYICKEHDEPVITDLEQPMKEDTPDDFPCQECGQLAPRQWVGLKFYAIVPGAHGGGPATK